MNKCGRNSTFNSISHNNLDIVESKPVIVGDESPVLVMPAPYVRYRSWYSSWWPLSLSEMSDYNVAFTSTLQSRKAFICLRWLTNHLIKFLTDLGVPIVSIQKYDRHRPIIALCFGYYSFFPIEIQ